MNGLLFVEPPPDEGYRLAAGATLMAFPKCPGSSSYVFLPLPAVDYSNANGAFASTDIGVGWQLSKRKDLQTGFRLWPQLARKSSDSGRLSGLEPIGARLEKGAFLNYSPSEVLMLQSGLRYGAGRQGDGLLIEVGATSGLPLPGGDLLGFSLGVTWANQAWRQSYFGISRQESFASGMPAYDLGAGWQDAQLMLSYEHRSADKWTLDSQITLARLLGEAAQSPITESARQATLSLSIWHAF